jgi:hypothetical protein
MKNKKKQAILKNYNYATNSKDSTYSFKNLIRIKKKFSINFSSE